MPTPSILFLCVHNAGRSQMAAAYARRLGGDRLRVHSGGSAPGEHLNPAVVEAMREAGIDLAGESPKRLTDALSADADVVVTMGCGDACPYILGKRYLDWQLDDPAGQPLQVVRRIRDDVRAHVQQLLDDLTAPPADGKA